MVRSLADTLAVDDGVSRSMDVMSLFAVHETAAGGHTLQDPKLWVPKVTSGTVCHDSGRYGAGNRLGGSIDPYVMCRMAIVGRAPEVDTSAFRGMGSARYAGRTSGRLWKKGPDRVNILREIMDPRKGAADARACAKWQSWPHDPDWQTGPSTHRCGCVAICRTRR